MEKEERQKDLERVKRKCQEFWILVVRVLVVVGLGVHADQSWRFKNFIDRYFDHHYPHLTYPIDYVKDKELGWINVKNEVNEFTRFLMHRALQDEVTDSSTT